MRNKSLQLCGMSLMLGIFGAFLRWLQSNSVYDPITRLATPYAPMSLVVSAFLIITAASLFLLVRKLKGSYAPEKYPDIFRRPNQIYKLAAYIIGAVMAVGGILTLLSVLSAPRAASDGPNFFGLFAGIFAIICAISIISIIITANSKVNGTGTSPLCFIIIILFMCFWLISAYKSNASDPVVWHFVIKILSISAALLAFYYFAGFSFGKPKLLSSLYFSLFAATLLIASLADDGDLGQHLISIALAATLILLSFASINNLQSSPPERVTE